MFEQSRNYQEIKIAATKWQLHSRVRSDAMAAVPLTAADITLNFNHNHCAPEILSQLLALANELQLAPAIAKQFQAEVVNHSERRPALHTALRDFKVSPIMVNNENIVPKIEATYQKMTALVHAIHNSDWCGATGSAIRDIVNIGIGGSDLGPRLLYEALAPYRHPQINCHFVANIDPAEIEEVLKGLDPARTLFIVTSKSFTTQETLQNALIAKNWLMQNLGNVDVLQQHMLAVTAAPEKALQLGLPRTNVFPMWDWIGGRFSVLSAVGLSVAISLGMANFEAVRRGAYQMDCHFREAPFAENIPVILALLDVWYATFLSVPTRLILPYSHALRSLPRYLQQLHMESLGKSVTQTGEVVQYPTGPIIWGDVATPSQHSFHQLLYQGTQRVPIDIIVPQHSHYDATCYRHLLANAEAQMQALWYGQALSTIEAELLEQGLQADEAQRLARYQFIPNQQPFNQLTLPQVTPATLGALLAMYEHKVFAQATLLQINAFDQWGVELGKKLACGKASRTSEVV